MKHPFRSLPVVVVACGFLSWLNLRAAEERVALVIGNNSYANARPLANPINDASVMADSLRSVGFTVILRTDTDLKAMKSAVREFVQALPSGGVGLVYYAGHGVQVKGQNYLIPIDAAMAEEFEVPDETLALDSLLRGLEQGGTALNIIVLDCCRDDPYSRSWRGARSTGGAGGLSMPADMPQGMFIAFSTSPGKTAADGDGANSPYTLSLVEEISRPGLDFEKVFKNVGAKVAKATQGQQEPWFNTKFYGDFVFQPTGPAQPAGPEAVPATSSSGTPASGMTGGLGAASATKASMLDNLDVGKLPLGSVPLPNALPTAPAMSPTTPVSTDKPLELLPLETLLAKARGTGEPFYFTAEPPPFQASLAEDPHASQRVFPRLTQSSSKANDITDEEAWMAKNGISPMFLKVPNPFMQTFGELPETVPARVEDIISVAAFRDDEYGYVIYGRDFASGTQLTIWTADFGTLLGQYDFENYTTGTKTVAGEENYVFQAVTYAQIREDILYVSHSHNTYSKSSGGQNAYITAFDLTTGGMLWRSAPLVCNSRNFIVSQDGIICGYGFTDEDDFVHVLNRWSGATQTTIKVKSGPELLSMQGNILHVRAYNTDYQFRLD
jgi:uncharacterized caspase-like protein